MAIVLWSAHLQLAAVRSAFFISLTQGGACQRLAKNNKADLLEWANREGIDPQWLLHESEETFEGSVPDTDGGPIAGVALAWTRGIIKDAGSAYPKDYGCGDPGLETGEETTFAL